MEIPRIMIAAGSSGSGKTAITCGLLQVFKNRGLNAVSFKCGPDYIDPLFHKTVLGIPSKNLDTFFVPPGIVQGLMAETAAYADISVTEGVMGYYDGAGIRTHTASSYELAKATGTPVILIVNARGMGISVIAYVKGFLEYKACSGIKAVILNQASKTVYNELKPLIEKELGITVAGYLPVMPECHLESRHLGLVLPEEIEGIQQIINDMAVKMEECIDIDKIISIAKSAPCININPVEARPVCSYGKVRIGVAMDEAFCFYYEDNLRLLEKFGARLVYFSPLHEKKLPGNIDGCIFGGGYPELYLKELSSNTSMLKSVKQELSVNQMPYIAECGGFLYLHENMEDTCHNNYKLAGVIQADAIYKGKLQRFGYVTLSPAACASAGNKEIKAHEFHYYDSTDNGKSYIAAKPFRNMRWECIHETGHGFAGFPHLYFYSCPGFAREFVEKCLHYSLVRNDS
ncbi:MAG: cobyrinate a,c-diamide synthase [Lachnospiraceae bacterium]|nr:cobyrinate a,c-diamide synthase [Lachnospiraceae bacterium]